MERRMRRVRLRSRRYCRELNLAVCIRDRCANQDEEEEDLEGGN